MSEIWKPVPGYEGYEVTAGGRVRRVFEPDFWTRSVRPPQVLKERGVRANGLRPPQVRVVLRGRPTTILVGKLVALAFPEGTDEDR
jgi:hypothetical protein